MTPAILQEETADTLYFFTLRIYIAPANLLYLIPNI